MSRIRFRTAVLVGAAAALLVAAAATAAVGIHRSAVKNGGTLVVGLTAGEPDALDPTLARTFSGREVFLTFCEKLYDLNAKAQIVPQLATALPDDLEGQADRHDPAPHGDQVQRRHAVQRGSGRDDARARPHAEGLGARERDLADHRASTASGASTVVIHLKTPYSPLTAQLADRAGMIMSPAQLDKLGASFATQPGLRRPVQVPEPRRRRQHHGRQVAGLLRQEERPPRQDRLQGRERRGCSGGGAEGRRPAGSRRHRLDAAARASRATRASGSSSRRRSATRGSRSTSATRTGSASCRTRMSARRSRRTPTCGRRSRRRSTARR